MRTQNRHRLTHISQILGRNPRKKCQSVSISPSGNQFLRYYSMTMLFCTGVMMNVNS